jgi:integrase
MQGNILGKFSLPLFSTAIFEPYRATMFVRRLYRRQIYSQGFTKGWCAQMAKHGENIYRRKDGRWEARVIKGHNEQGKALYAYFYGRTYKEAKDKIFVSLPCIKGYSAAMPDTTESASRFDTVLDAWLGNKEIRLKKSSYVKYFNLINNNIKPSLGQYALTDITGPVLNSYIAEIHRTGRRDTAGGLSEKTVKDIAMVIKSVLRFAKDEGLLSEAVHINLTLPREKPKDMRVLSKDEQAVFEKFLSSNMDASKLGILLCLYTGLRIGEICALRWSDIALDANTLTVSRTMQRVQTLDAACSSKTEIVVTEPKSDCSTRTIPLPDCLIGTLKMFKPVNPNAYFLTGETGRHIEPRTYQNHFKAYIIGSSIKDANFHSTRHTFATRCIELGFEIKSLSEILGHANVNITLNRYVHPSFDLKRSNMNKLERLH